MRLQDHIRALYRAICVTGEKDPPVTRVKARLGGAAPGYDLLRMWASGAKIPAPEQVLMLLVQAEAGVPGTWAQRAEIQGAWWRATEAEWTATGAKADALEVQDAT
jgi:hypothetical protein